MSSINIGARYGATPPPAPVVAQSGAAATMQAEGDASASILRRAIDIAATETSGLLASLPDQNGSAEPPLQPIGNVGRHFDSRL